MFSQRKDNIRFKHLCNVVYNKHTNKENYVLRYPEKTKTFLDTYNPILTINFPQKEYMVRDKNDKTTLHLGQRKLLMAELQLLLPIYKDITHILYVGAGPGQHINLLIKWFPHIKWKLYDPVFSTKLDKHLNSSKNKGIVEIYPTIFTDEDAIRIADEWKEYNFVFISDIRKKDEKDDFPSNECIKEDMEDQMRWYTILNPFRSEFKFRLPWVNIESENELTTYLKGDIYFPIWGKPSTTESRLIVEKDSPIVYYDNKKYQDQMFYFNSEHRVSCFNHDCKSDIYCYCHDCKSEIELLKQLVTIVGTNIIKLSNDISYYLYQYP